MTGRVLGRLNPIEGFRTLCLLVLTIVPSFAASVFPQTQQRRSLLSAEPPVPVYWVLLVGDTSVGKSSMVQRFMEDTFTPEFRVTEGAYGKQKDIQLTQGPAKLQVWDTAGTVHFQKVVTSIYRGVHAVMVVYDPHNRTSFEQAQSHWAPEVAEFAAPGSLRYLVSTKDDLGPGEVAPAEAQSLADAQSMTFIETSARDNRNVTSLFVNTGQRIRNAADVQASLTTS